MKRPVAKSWRTLRHRAHRLGQVGLWDAALLAEASVRLAAARIAIATRPFPAIARKMGGFMAPQHAAAKAEPHPPSPEDQEIARKIGWAVTRAARHLPFEAVCLPQAMAGHAMLKKRNIFGIIHFGTMRGEAMSLAAHAWLNAGDVEVTGYPVEAAFTEIACIA